MLDELLIGGEVQETSKKNVLKAISAQDLLQEVLFLVLSGTLLPPGVLYSHLCMGQLDKGLRSCIKTLLQVNSLDTQF